MAYEALPIGKPIGSMSYDRLDPHRAEFSRYGLQQIYFPPITNVLAEDGVPGDPVWFGVDKRTLTTKWPSWLTLLAITEDDNEGVFGPPPPTGSFVRVAPAASVNTLSYTPNAHTLQGWRQSDADLKRIVERDGLGQHLAWSGSGRAGDRSGHRPGP